MKGNRKNKFKLAVVLGLFVGNLLFTGCSANKPLPNIYEEELELEGIDREYEILFLADSHISLCDERDPEVMEKAAGRYEMFRGPEGKGADETFHGIMTWVKTEKPDLLVLGGDLIDSAMEASIDFVKGELENTGVKWVYSMGNHDFEYGSEYFSEKAYEEYLPRLSELSATRKGYQIADMVDFFVFLADDAGNRIGKEAVDALENLCRENKPVLLVTHVPVEPLTDDTLRRESINVWGAGEEGRSRVLLGENSCQPDDDTQRLLDLVYDEKSSIQLVLAGHIHFYHRDLINKRLIQVVTGAGFENEIVKVIVKPKKNTD